MIIFRLKSWIKLSDKSRNLDFQTSKIFVKFSLFILVITCSDPSGVQYSHKIPTRGPYRCGGHVTYLCNHGYKLQGDPTRRCQDNGTFSRRQAVCVKDNDVGGTLR